MDKITVSTFELFQLFPDAESARLYFEARRWPKEAKKKLRKKARKAKKVEDRK